MAKQKKGDGDGLRALFLDSAREILREPETSLDLRKVAERAGKSRTAPYLAFGPTEEGGGLSALRVAVAAEGFSELSQRMERAHRSAEDPEEGLRRAAAAYLQFARDEPRLFRLMFGSEVGRAQSETSASGRGRWERDNLKDARARTEWVFLQAIQMDDPGYLRQDLAFAPHEMAGAVWSLLHGVAMLMIDEQWDTTRLGILDDPETLAARALRLLTTTAWEEIQPAGEALMAATRQKASKGDGGLSDPVELPSTAHAPQALELQESVTHMFPPRMSQPAEARPADFSAIRRARELSHLIRDARILWVDDHPELSMHEEEVFSALGAQVVRARNAQEAVKALNETGADPYDVIISDIARGDAPDAGVRELPALRRHAPDTPMIFYVGRVQPEMGTPRGAFGITDEPEELVHLVFDALERKRG